MTRISTGLVTIDAGETIVTGWIGDAGVALSEVSAPASSPVVIEGVANFIKQRISTTSFELVLPHAGTGGADLACAISALIGSEKSISTLNGRVATAIQQLNVLDANGRGLFYNLIGVTGDNDPGPGNMAFDNADPALVTELYLDVLDANAGGRDVAGLIGLWAPGTVLIVRSLASAAYAAFQLTTGPVDASGFRRVAVEPAGSDGTLAAEPVAIEWKLKGDQGDSFAADQEVDTLSERAAFDGEPPRFVIKVNDAGDGRAAFFTMGTGGVGDWGAPAYLTGAQGDASTVPGPVGPSGISWRGSYNPTTAYMLRDGVLDNGSSWIALGSTTGNAPPALPTTSNAYWLLLARRGVDGAGTVAGVSPGTGIAVDNTDPATPEISVEAFTGDSGAGGVLGGVPAPAAGDAAAGKVLGAGGGWVDPPAGGGGSATNTTFDNTDAALPGAPANVQDAIDEIVELSTAPRVGFSASMGANFTGTASVGTYQNIAGFNTERWDEGGYFNTANGRWTPPAGRYLITAYLTAGTGTQNATNFAVVLMKNGAPLIEIGRPINGAGVQQSFALTGIVEVDGDDYLSLALVHTSGTTFTVYGSQYSVFQGVQA